MSSQQKQCECEAPESEQAAPSRLKRLLFGPGGPDISGSMLASDDRWDVIGIVKIFFLPILLMIAIDLIFLPGQKLPLALQSVLLPILYLVAVWWFHPHRRAGAVNPSRLLPDDIDPRHIAACGLIWAVVMRVITYAIIAVQFALFDASQEALYVNNPFLMETELLRWEQALLVLSVVVLGPIWEEVFFRGILYRSMGSRWGVAPAAAVSSLLFALMHGSLLLIPALFVLGVIMVALYESTQSLWYPISAHILFNATSVTALLLL